MKVTRLRLHGFKSFVDAADIPIHPGVTGIIGPNGCGKSNLIEALRFVMGESSYKAMRGGGMEDVIFAGSAKRPGRNMAEVTLVAERDGRKPAQGPETLEITRRIEREQGSTYRVNGREVRARDVQLLFADAATGAHSSAMVRQGQVAELIAAKPVQRRGILEDAAGISGLHSRRSEAEGKLKAAEANLERLVDVMNEIAGRLEGLRRQARQATRYRKLSTEIRKAEAVLYLAQWETAGARLAEAETELGLTGGFEAALAAQGEAAKNEAVAATRLPELREAVAAAASGLQQLRRAAQEIDREESLLKARGEELQARRAQAVADLEHETEIARDAEAALNRLQDEEAGLSPDAEATAGRIASVGARSDAAAAALAATEAEFATVAGLLAAAAAERASRERTIRDGHARLRRLEDERGAVLRERDRLQSEAGHDGEVRSAALALAQAEALLAQREAEAQSADAALATARETERRARGPYEATERNLGALQAEARTLAELLDLDRTQRFAPVLDSIDVTPGYEQALAAGLGDDLDASLDPDAPAYWGPSGPSDQDLALPYGAEPLSKFVRAPAALARRLRQIGVVEADAAATLQQDLAAGQRLVTLEGGLWRWDGLHARPGTGTAGSRRLEQRSRVAALVQELKTARATVEKALDILGAAAQVRADAEKLDADARAALREARQGLEARRALFAEAERRASRTSERLSAYAGALARIEADTAGTRAELRAAGEALQALPDTAEAEGRRDDLQGRLARDRQAAAEARSEADQASREDQVRSRRSAELATERQRWAARVERAAARTGELRDRLARIDSDLRALAERPQGFATARRRLMTEMERAERSQAEAAEALAAAERGHHDAAAAARSAFEALSQAREKRARDEERAIAARARRDELAGQIREHFGRQPQELRGLAGLAPAATLPAGGVVESKLQKLKNERDKLGGVNLRAEEEARELETRLEAMRKEHDDLQEAIKRLRQGIQNLNREGRERLLAAFEKVDGHFRSLFHTLFGGGTAELALTEADDPLDAGLEIIARPPGKRPQTMTLLSGGEQALTALSLIFAVFLTNPSPICVLDEVDAPLDDANVERFCALLDDMRRRTDTRFVVVTHNPITMARMDRLFGVTMAEQGVSQVVSVDLSSAERFREAS
jgi:chromosome segregation protein